VRLPSNCHALPLPANNDARPLFPRLGAWLFRRRTWIPIPLALALLLIPAGNSRRASLLVAVGAAIVVAAESLRLWAVLHIGVVSRTRSDRLGPLVSTGPFAIVRNPLYLGNIALWAGFAISARILWLVPVFIIVLSIEYHAIVRWEESLLESRRGDEYRGYAARVPRWWPRSRQSTVVSRQSVSSRQSAVDRDPSSVDHRATIADRRATTDNRRLTFSWRETLFSERGTLIAIALGYVLLWMKNDLWR
jgi:protein-S-isoprenylcysteine O-methyltransferase Ste14